jgi:hypothetical protein
LGVVSDGQHPIRRAVAGVLPGVPHQLCQFHYLREAAKEVYEAERHAKKELKAQKARARVEAHRAGVGGQGRRRSRGRVRGYCLAVRSAITDVGRAPLSASGIKLHDRIEAIEGSIERVVGAKRGFQES